ncbi:MAG: molecular chaperone DnaJ [Patescibacteria group bacterium]|jgi:molecular chaperone DnaJ
MSKDYYQTLGVNKNATQDEIKKAFRKKAHEHHPDKGGGNEAKFKEINEAYQVLGNAEKKQRYDQFGSSDFSGFGGGGGAGQGGFNWSDFARQGGGQQYSNANFDFSDLGDIFGDFFGGGSHQRSSRSSGRPTHGADLEINVTITLENAYFGVEKLFDINKDAPCLHCSSTGVEPGAKVNTCKTCNGSGQVTANQQTFFGAFRTVTVCPNCQGEGKIPEKKCSTCQGQGVVKERVSLKINIPAGINTGQTLKMSGQGQAGPKGTRSGDLFVNVKVLPDARFGRNGDDLHLDESISFSQAVLGDKIMVKTFDGEVKLKIPAGTSPGQEFIIKGKGLPHLQKHGTGNLYVKVKVVVPKHLSSSQKDLLEKLQREGL